MIVIDTPTKNKKVREFLIGLKEVQKEMETDEESVYPCIPLNIALKYNILFNDFMFHELVLRKRKFYDDCDFFTKKSTVVKVITEVLEYELTNEGTLSETTLFKMIRAHKRLSNAKKLG